VHFDFSVIMVRLGCIQSNARTNRLQQANELTIAGTIDFVQVKQAIPFSGHEPILANHINLIPEQNVRRKVYASAWDTHRFEILKQQLPNSMQLRYWHVS
jgi:hypothetical protein